MEEEILGYKFRNAALLDEALTTPSCRMTSPDLADNQRLEFLGDAVLGFLAADLLFRSHPDEHEGPLTVMRTRMVSAAALAAAANRHGLSQRLRRNKGAEGQPVGAKTLADAVEAVIGAAYIDGGLDAARAVFGALGLAERADGDEWTENPKGELQVRAQALVPPRHPSYTLLKTEGTAHEPLFTVEVSVEGMGSATASARSHKEAESRAAAKLLSTLSKTEQEGRQPA